MTPGNASTSNAQRSAADAHVAETVGFVEPESPTSRWRFAMLVFGCWTAAALISMSASFTFGPLREEKAPLLPVLFTQLGIWWFWAAITPVVWWLGRRFPFERKRFAKSIGIHAICAVVIATLFALAAVVVVFITLYATASKESFATIFRGFLSSRLPLGIVLYFAVLGVGSALDSQKRLRQREVHASLLSAALARAQVQALQTQLQPHFLFNTLHAIGMLVHEDPAAAARMLTRLGDLLRQTLALTDVPEISLRDELSVLNDYIGIERVRFGDRLTVEIDVDEALLDAAVPTFVMQPLVENAVRFGVTSRVGPGRIRISAKRIDDSLRLSVDDEGPDVSATKAAETPSPNSQASLSQSSFAPMARDGRNGVGLASTRARLSTLYPPPLGASIELHKLQNGGTTAVVTLPWRMIHA